ncbi:MAG: saccharopine dehydrogenase C-terminal domain-containing protein [Acidobacteriota bacterium]
MSRTQVVVLGAGRVGRAMAWDLARDFAVTAVDVSESNLHWLAQRNVATVKADVSDAGELARVVREASWVVNAVPGFLGYRVLSELVALGKNVVDISFMPEDPRALDGEAKAKGLLVAVDCGVAPGLSHLVLGYWYARAAKLETFTCYVGGLPRERVLPWEYKAPFSPVDVLEEYTRPARLRRNGAVVTLPAMAEPELVYIPEVGTLEAFLTDGMRTALETVPIPHMEEKTLRYPGYREKILLLKASGLLDGEPVEVSGVEVSPLSVTAKALAKAWQFAENEADLTVMVLKAEGFFAGERQERSLFLYDSFDPATGLSSMARSTGFTATAVLRALVAGYHREPGVLVPEVLGQNADLTRFVVSSLRERGLAIRAEDL